METINHLNLGALYVIGVAFAAVCFAIGAGVGWLLNRGRR